MNAPNPLRKSFLKSPEEIASDKIAREKSLAEKTARERPRPSSSAGGAVAEANLPFARHVLVCSGPHCNGLKQSHAIKATLQARLEAEGMAKTIKLNMVNCFDLCASAPNCIVYPDGVIYAHVKVEDVPEIIESHLKNNQPIERLKRKL